MSASIWILLWCLLLIEAGCTSKPISHDRPEADQKSSTTEPPPSQKAATSDYSATKPRGDVRPESSESKKAGSEPMTDLDEIARQAELEEAKKRQKAAQPTVLPPGTLVYIHLSTEVGSKVSKSGDDFSGTLAAPVAIEDHVVIPADASVAGRVVRAKRAGRFKGGAILSLELRSILVNGKKHLVHTQMVTTESKGNGKQTAGLGASGTGGGTAVGAPPGGGKGAPIGATAGGTAAGLTGKRDITLPVETLVAFRLSDPLEIKQSVAEKTEAVH